MAKVQYPQSIRIKIGNRTWDSMTECASELNCHFSTVKRHYRRGDLDKLLVESIAERKGFIDWTTYSVKWRDIEFKNAAELSKAIDRNEQVIRQHFHKYGTLDYLWPGPNSEHYDSDTQNDKLSFVAQAVKDYGVKAVARAFKISAKSIRSRRDSGTLWQLAFPRPPRANSHSDCIRAVVYTEVELTEYLSK